MAQVEPAAMRGSMENCGKAAIDGISALIMDAVRNSDDARAGALDRVLREIEKLVTLSRMLPVGLNSMTTAPCSVHERQAPYFAKSQSQPADLNDVTPVYASARSRSQALTTREIEILDFLVRGDTDRVIAQELNISEATVHSQVKAILQKLRVKNRTQAAVYAVRMGPTGLSSSSKTG